MAKLIHLETHSDKRGNLTVLEKVLPFQINRVFYIYGVDDSVRGGHRHHLTDQACICLRGSCTIFCDNNRTQEEYVLDNPTQCLILFREDWHTMFNFTPDSILLVFASTEFDPDDYIFEPYHHHNQ